MNYSIHRISLDIHKVGSQAVLNVKRGDTARSICITLMENGKPYEIFENCSAVFSAKKPDGNYILNDCIIQDNKLVYNFTPQTAPVAGTMECEVSLYDESGNQITSPRFLIVVDEIVYNGEEIVSSSEANVLKELVEEASEVIARAEEAAEEARGYATRAYELVGEKASAIISQASGDVITLSDSSDLPLRDLKVYGKTEQFTTQGKNLIPFPYITADKTTNGITFTVQNDGGVKVVGTATGDAFFNLCQYHFSDNSGLTSTGAGVNTDGTIVISGGVDASASVVYHASNNFTFIVVAKGATVNTVIYPQIEYGTTPTKYEPYTGGMPSPNPDYPQSMDSVGEDGFINCSVTGKNFYADGDISVYETKNRMALSAPIPAGTYTVSVEFENDSTSYTSGLIFFLYANGTVFNANFAKGGRASRTVTFTDTVTSLSFYAANNATASVGVTASYTRIQIELGSTATEYESYQSQSVTIPTPNGLRGVPVNSGGNYTDANGQQWVCDEVDFKRGVYVQRVGSVDLGTLTYGQSTTSTEGQYRFAASPLRNEILSTVKVVPNDAKAAVLSNGFVVSTASELYSGSYGIAVGKDGDVYIRAEQLNDLTTDGVKSAVSGFMFYYELAEPVEIPLDEATLSAFSALHTNKPNTTITNDSSAWMSAEYVADTKLYIDNKFAELASAIISNS